MSLTLTGKDVDRQEKNKQIHTLPIAEWNDYFLEVLFGGTTNNPENLTFN